MVGSPCFSLFCFAWHNNNNNNEKTDWEICLHLFFAKESPLSHDFIKFYLFIVSSSASVLSSTHAAHANFFTHTHLQVNEECEMKNLLKWNINNIIHKKRMPWLVFCSKATRNKNIYLVNLYFEVRQHRSIDIKKLLRLHFLLLSWWILCFFVIVTSLEYVIFLAFQFHSPGKKKEITTQISQLFKWDSSRLWIVGTIKKKCEKRSILTRAQIHNELWQRIFGASGMAKVGPLRLIWLRCRCYCFALYFFPRSSFLLCDAKSLCCSAMRMIRSLSSSW